MRMRFLKKSILATGLAFGMFAAGAQAVTVDLTVNSSGWAGGALFANVDPSGSQGTGVFEPFVRIQGTGQGDTQEGYNTDGTLEFDTKAGVWTHSVEFTDMDLFTCADFAAGDTDCDGTAEYYLFVLDYNQTAQQPLLSIDAIEIYETANGSLTGYDAGADWASQLFDLGDNNVLLDYNLTGTGSGGGDLFAFIPLDGITLQYMVMYSKFGDTPGYERNDGFEEWAFVVGPGCQDGDPNCDGDNVVPEPSSMLMMGGGLLGLAWWRRRKNS